MTERPGSTERVVLVHVNFPAGKMAEDLDEFRDLAISAGAEIAAEITCARRVPDAKFFVGSGKAEEIRDQVTATGATLVIFNHVLSPGQERNLERLVNCRVINRTGLILDIFAQRARSFEGNLQVELALLKHLSTRLVRGWTHLERQRGGIGLRGPGETQLEVDRRLIRNKIKVITAHLAKIRTQREQGRRSRRRAIVPTVSLVGYTNAGKSTLFNRLTGAKVYVADQLFATLDPTLRRVDLPAVGPVILADTVGFIRHLPHDLVEAFHATLEEVAEADLLLHVIDANDDKRDLHSEQVEVVLQLIGAESVPRIEVYNKIDLNTTLRPKMDRDAQGQVTRIYLSAAKDMGIEELAIAVAERLSLELVEREVCLLPGQDKLRAALYARDSIIAETIDEAGHYCLTIRLPRVELNKLFLTN